MRGWGIHRYKMGNKRPQRNWASAPPEDAQRSRVPGNSMVLVITRHHRPKPCACLTGTIRGRCLIRSPVHPAVQIDQSILQPGFILLPRHATYSRCSLPLYGEKAVPQKIDTQMVEQSGESSNHGRCCDRRDGWSGLNSARKITSEPWLAMTSFPRERSGALIWSAGRGVLLKLLTKPTLLEMAVLVGKPSK
jgi:hypothetical protein